MKYLITGGYGFLGRHIINEGDNRYLDKITLGLNKANDIKCDLSSDTFNLDNHKFDFVVHCAGLAHKSSNTFSHKKRFFDINCLGTYNLLKSLESTECPEQFILISTVSVYGVEKGEMINEEQPLNGVSAYSRSSILKEKIVQNWCKQNEVKLLILRLPLVIGHNPKGNLQSMIRLIKKGYYFSLQTKCIRKSMVLASDVANCIFNNIGKEGIYNLTDGRNHCIKELETTLGEFYKKPIYKIKIVPTTLLIYMNKRFNKLLNQLTFDSKKAIHKLKWNPKSVLSLYKH